MKDKEDKIVPRLFITIWEIMQILYVPEIIGVCVSVLIIGMFLGLTGLVMSLFVDIVKDIKWVQQFVRWMAVEIKKRQGGNHAKF
jgi:hypothetical protein